MSRSCKVVGDIEPFSGDHAPKFVDLTTNDTDVAETQPTMQELCNEEPVTEQEIKTEPCDIPHSSTVCTDQDSADHATKVVVAVAGSFLVGVVVGALVVAVFSQCDNE